MRQRPQPLQCIFNFSNTQKISGRTILVLGFGERRLFNKERAVWWFRVLDVDFPSQSLDPVFLLTLSEAMKKVSLALFICAMGLTLPISHYTFVRII
jgi:hypothetical protein